MSKLYFYSSSTSNRLRYITQLIFEDLLGLELVLIENKADFLSLKGAKINYTHQYVAEESFWIPAHTLLFEKDIKDQEIAIIHATPFPYFFELSKSTADLSFDLLAMSFYLVSRYEEYLPFEADGHGRFPAKESLAFRSGFLNQALVNLWAMRLGEHLQKKNPSLQIQLPLYKFQPTFDIDMAWAYCHKGIVRTTGAYMKDLLLGRFRQIAQRTAVLLGQQSDPFYIFDYLSKVHVQFSTKPIFFFLLGQRSAYDKNISPHNPTFKTLIKGISQAYEIGIHPSYLSNNDTNLLFDESQTLQKITNKTVTNSRQHFLKLHLPTTYRNLTLMGIEKEYSMGYASALGFRASIATPFYWYDLEYDLMTTLQIHPFQIMDVTLKEYLKLDLQVAKKEIEKMISATKAAHGQFIPIWHNSSFTKEEGWEGWTRVYEFLLENAQSE